MWWLAEPISDKASDSNNSTPIVDDTCDPAAWDAYVAGHPAGTLYHTQSWQKVLFDSFGFNTLRLVCRQDGRLSGILPLTIIKGLFGTYLASCAFADYGGICADTENDGRVLLEAAEELVRKYSAKRAELRHVAPVTGHLNTLQTKVLSVLKLAPDTEVLWGRLGAKLRNQIRKSQKAGFSVEWGGLSLVDCFYSVYCRNMRDLGTPALGRQFFVNLLSLFAGTAEVLVLSRDGKPVSAAVALTYRKTMEVPWASSRRDYFHLCPNNLLYWELLSRAVKKGLSYFSFGRSTVGSSTYRFKEQWGTENILLNYQAIEASGGAVSQLSSTNPRFALAIRVWKRLPLRVAALIGPRIASGLG